MTEERKVTEEKYLEEPYSGLVGSPYKGNRQQDDDEDCSEADQVADLMGSNEYQECQQSEREEQDPEA